MGRENVVDITLDDASLAGADIANNKDLVQELLLDIFLAIKFGCLFFY